MRKKELRIVVLLWGLTACALALAWYLSSQTGEETGKLSRLISAAISNILGISADAVPLVDTIIRKAAHIGVYFILTGLATSASIYTFPGRDTAWLWPLGPLVIISIIDEMRKHSIPGRHSSWVEAGLNALGCVVGAVVVWRFSRIFDK